MREPYNRMQGRPLNPSHSRIAILGALISAAVSGCKSHDKDTSKYETAPVTKGTLVAKVTASGTLSALVTVTIGAQVSGRIVRLHADFNSPVTKGELLAEIDPLLFQATLDSQVADVVTANAQIASAIATQELNQANYDRAVKLFALKLMDQADYDTAKGNLDVAKAAVMTARGNLLTQQAQVRQAKANLDYTKIISPINGVVISRTVDVGQTVVSSYQAPALFTIAQDLQKMQVDTNVAESDIGRVKIGAVASFTVDAYPAERFKGRIRQIRDAPQTVQNVVTYDVVIDVDNLDFRLLPGMTANAEFVTDTREDVLHVSNAVFRFHPPPDFEGVATGHKHEHGSAEASGDEADAGTREGHHRHSEVDSGIDGGTGEGHHSHGGGEGRAGGEGGERKSNRKTLWVLRDGKPVSVNVKIGISDGHETEIVEGELAVGDAVLTGVATDPKAGGGAMRRMF